MESSVRRNFPVTGMSCAVCALSVESMLKSQNGVKSASVNFASSSVWVEYNSSITGSKEFRKAVQSIGYDIITDKKEAHQQEAVTLLESAILKQKTLRAALLTIPIVVIGMFLMDLPYANWIMLVLSTPVVFWYGRNFFINAYKQLKHGKTNMDTLVALSTSIAYFFSMVNTVFPHLIGHSENHPPVYFEASAVIIVFILLGKLLEEKAKASTSSAIKKLMGLQSDSVTMVYDDGTESILSISEVQLIKNQK